MSDWVGVVLPLLLLGTVYVSRQTGHGYVVQALGNVGTAFMILLLYKIVGLWLVTAIPWTEYFSRETLSLVRLPAIIGVLMPTATDVLGLALVLTFMMGFASVIFAARRLSDATLADQLARKEKTFQARRR